MELCAHIHKVANILKIPQKISIARNYLQIMEEKMSMNKGHGRKNIINAKMFTNIMED